MDGADTDVHRGREHCTALCGGANGTKCGKGSAQVPASASAQQTGAKIVRNSEPPVSVTLIRRHLAKRKLRGEDRMAHLLSSRAGGPKACPSALSPQADKDFPRSQGTRRV